MKKLIFILFLLPSMLINAQIVDFNPEQMDSVMFATLNDNGGYVLTHSPVEKKIYRYIKRKNDEMLPKDIITHINRKISLDFVGIFDMVNGFKGCTYQSIAERCNKDWNNPSDAFFKNGWGSNIIIVSYYNRKTDKYFVFVGYK